MKKLILLGLAVVVFTACQKSEPVRWTLTSPEVDETKALVKDYEDGNWESWASHYGDTAKAYHNSLTGITPQELQEGFATNNANLSSYGFSDKNLFYEMVITDKGEKWVYFWGTWEGTVAATNKEVVVPVHLALQFAENKIIREFAYYDNAPIMAALSEIEKPEEEGAMEE